VSESAPTATVVPGRIPTVTIGSILATSLPAAGAIGVFGAIYGAAARPVLGVPLTLGSSLCIFSGALQFALVGLLGVGAATPALLLLAGMLNLRHPVLGAVLRPRIAGSRWRRAVLAFFLLDETVGFAMVAGETAARDARLAATMAARTLWVSGLACYLFWQAGTLIGVLGADTVLTGVEPLARAIFPVLFIGLATLTAAGRSHAVRALGAALLTAGWALALPELRALAPVLAGLVVALPGRES
jgi:predicted branched-subunit amino acid permease